MVIYKAIQGSQSYGLEFENSDMDIAIASPLYRSMRGERRAYDLYSLSPSEFIRLSLWSKWFSSQYCFPHELCLDNDLSLWIADNREDMVKAQMHDVYKMFMVISADFSRDADRRYIYGEGLGTKKRQLRTGRKKIAYAIHFRNILFNYANGMTFAEAHKAQGETRDFLLAVRRGEVPIKLVLEENAKARERAKSVAGYYQKPRADLSVLDEFKYMVQREAQRLKGSEVNDLHR